MQYLGAAVDVFHAMLMIVWIAGLPLLFWHRYFTISKVYFWFALGFIIVNQLSHYLLGCCILTTLAHYFYSRSNGPSNDEWFSVRFAYFIFGLTPSHRGVKITTEILIAIAAIGGLFYARRRNNDRKV